MPNAAQKIAAIEAFDWTEDDQAAIVEAFKTKNPWAHRSKELEHVQTALSVLKRRLAALHLGLQGNKCCYCRTLLHGGGVFMIDREHILPKRRYRGLTYDAFNLSVSCKRCNMEFKGQRVDFVLDPETILVDYKDPARYQLIHPNFDTWLDHLDRFVVQSGDHELVAYKVENGSEKGRYTYEFFDLVGLQIRSFDEAQGLVVLDEVQDRMRQALDRTT